MTPDYVHKDQSFHCDLLDEKGLLECVRSGESRTKGRGSRVTSGLRRSGRQSV